MRLLTQWVPALLCVLLLVAGCRVEEGPTKEAPLEEAPAKEGGVWHPVMPGEVEEARLGNIALRSGSAPDYGEYGQGEYPAGEPLKEREVEGGMMIGAQFATAEQYAILKQAHFVPFRREMTDAELLEAIHPALREEHRGNLATIIEEMHERLRDVPEMPTDAPAGVEGVVPKGAEAAYDAWFEPDGALRRVEGRDLLWTAFPAREVGLWAAAYRNVGEEKWARAVVSVMEYYYHHVRPPAGKISGRTSQARHQWRTLNMGAFTPGYIEAYRAISGWPGLTQEQKVNFVKGAIERAQFLHFTTTPAFPWMKYNPFGYANWLLYQLQGELAIACAFPGLKEAEKWRQHAAEGVALQAAWSIQPDGSHDEFSHDYARQVAGQLNWCVLTLLRHGYALPAGLRGDVLRLNVQFAELFCPGGEKLPFGDSHPGKSALPAEARWASVMFLEPRLKYFAEEPGERFLRQMATILAPDAPEKWVEAYRQLEALPPDAERTASILPDVGWAVMRTGWEARGNAVSIGWRGSDRVAHSGREQLGLNIWARGRPVMTKLAGTRSYNGDYPEGYAQTPRLSNLVLLEDEKGGLLPFARTTGALRNWAASSRYDFVDAEHFGWAGGRVKARRRVLYVKPDWVVVIDDHAAVGEERAAGKVAMQWQAHVGGSRPEVRGEAAVWQRAGVYGMVWMPGAAPEVEALPVKGGAETYLLKARREAATGLGRWVSVFHFGVGEAEAGLEVKAISAGDYEGVRLPTSEGERFVVWEPAGVLEGGGSGESGGGDESGGGFVCVIKEKEAEFAAADVGALPARMQGALEKGGRGWNGRVVSPKQLPKQNEEGEREVRNFRLLPWSGQPQLGKEPRVLARFAWEVGSPALHTLRYRRADSAGSQEGGWRRVVAPVESREAWLLVPDLEQGATYEVQAVVEWPDGEVARSAIVSHSF